MLHFQTENYWYEDYATLKKIQNIDVMRPLSKLWHSLKSAVSATDDEANFTIEDLVQQRVLLVGETKDFVFCHRQFSRLAGAMKSTSW